LGHDRPAETATTNGCLRSESRTLAGGPPSDALAPIPVIRGTAIEPSSSTLSRRSGPRQPQSIEGARSREDDSACLVNHNFPICCRSFCLPSFPKMLLQSPRPRAADDFATIRARMEELRRERARVWAGGEPHPSIRPRPDASSSQPAAADKPRLLPAILRALARASRT